MLPRANAVWRAGHGCTAATLTLRSLLTLLLATVAANATGCDGTTEPGAPTELKCVNCHQQTWITTNDPVHQDAGFGQDCATCHVNLTWRPAPGYQHSAAFPLENSHATLTCKQCHSAPGKLPVACVGCHLAQWQGAKDPDHAASAISQVCQTCHDTKDWVPAPGYQHNKFPLTGKHKTAGCNGCHSKPSPLPLTCVGCHLAQWQGAKDPDHQSADISKECKTCHDTAGWSPAPGYNHDKFPLSGAHKSAKCSSCHSEPSPLPLTCAGCHLSQWQASAKPNHGESGFGQTCETCHDTSAWSPAPLFPHDKFFPLLGKHKTTPCAACHTTAKPPKLCSGCHLAQWQGATQPNHSLMGLSKQCESCHDNNAWKPAPGYKHNKYPLLGKHKAASCASCHTSAAPPPSLCAGCHLPQWQSAKDPDHVAVAMSKTCQTCHTVNGWKPAPGYKHNTYPLQGKHVGVSCGACHKPTGKTPTTCEGCHMAVWHQTTNPNHAALGLSQACAGCHAVSGWKPAKFPNHNPLFPISSGKHTNIACATCHTTSDWKAFSCVSSGCHPKSKMDKEHLGEVSGYAYESVKCYKCHPQGTEDD